MFTFFKNKARANVLRTAKQKLKRNMGFHNFESIKQVGIIVQYKLDVENAAMVKLLDFFKQKGAATQVLVYYPGKKLPTNATSTSNSLLICEGDTNWFGKPKKKEADDFAVIPFDILIDMSVQHIFSLQYLVEASKAAFKVGRISYPNDPYDFVLIGDNHNDSKYIDDLFDYLAKIQ